MKKKRNTEKKVRCIVSCFLKLFGRKGRKLVPKKRAKKDVKKEFTPVLKKLNLDRLL